MSVLAGVSATTRHTGVIGDPVRHSRSPALHNAAYAALGLDIVYGAYEVREGEARQALVGARSLGFLGLSVTTPHKEAIARAADQRSATVERLGAANTVCFRGGVAVAENTDGAGLLDDLAHAWGLDPAGRSCAVIGAGGAGRAVALALAQAGASSVVIVNRTESRAEQAAALVGPVARAGVVGDLGEMTLVVNATSLGLVGAVGADSGPTEDPRRASARALGAVLGAGQYVVDLVYHPERTAFLAEAAARGATVRNGLGMLVHQAAHQFLLHTGEVAPLEAMWAAVADVATS